MIPSTSSSSLLQHQLQHGRHRHPSVIALTLLSMLTLAPTDHHCDAFVIAPQHCHFQRGDQNARIPTARNSDILNNEDVTGAISDFPTLTGALAGAECIEFILKEHKPLGCSVEESLASEPDGSKYVFVAEVKDGGNAQKAGIEVGDCIVQLSGTFDEVLDVAGLGLDKIRSLVAGRPDESPLVIRVARGSDVKERHETSLVELCIVGDDAETAECITSIYKADDDVFIAGDDDMAACDEDYDTECLLDSMWESWTDGLPVTGGAEEEVEEVKEKKKKVAPWSSRSSPSGTYVRDPKTGKMVNIDE